MLLISHAHLIMKAHLLRLFVLLLSLFRWRLKTGFASGWTCRARVDSNLSLRRWSDKQRGKKKTNSEERYSTCLRFDAFYSTDRTDFLRGIVLIPPLFADTKNVSLLDAREIRRRWPNWTNERSEETNEAIGTQESSRKTDWGQENSVPEGKG